MFSLILFSYPIQSNLLLNKYKINATIYLQTQRKKIKEKEKKKIKKKEN